MPDGCLTRPGKGLPPSRAIAAQCPAGQWIRIRTVLTDNGKEFTDRLSGLRKRAATGKHEFDQLCTDHSPLSLGPMARHGSSSNSALPHRSIPRPMAWSPLMV